MCDAVPRVSAIVLSIACLEVDTGVRRLITLRATAEGLGFDVRQFCEGKAYTCLFFRKSLAMRLSARNVFPGRVLEVRRGQTTATVKIDVGSGMVITASITNEAVDDLALKPGDTASAVIKASEVIVGKE
jgi:molybdopterin-binding protein